MVVLRATRDVLRQLGGGAATEAESDTALGDWYLTRLVVDRRPLLLLIASKTYLPVLIPARDVRTLPDRLSELVGVRLRRGAVPAALIEAETARMDRVVVAPTNSRSVVGILVEFAQTVPYYLDRRAWDETTLPFVEQLLARTPCHATRRDEEVIFPDRDTVRRLEAMWGAG